MAFFNSLPNQFHSFVVGLFMFSQALVGLASTHSVVVVTPPVLARSVSVTSSTKLLHPSLANSILTTLASTSSPTTNNTSNVLTYVKNANPTAAALIPTDQLNDTTRGSLVNILCTTAAGGSFAPISGSGVIVDTRGVILTNAHVAQFFLLLNYRFANNIQCVIRTGSPAAPAYTATLLYLPPTWVAANASQITSSEAKGTGENDYAFLLITGTPGTGLSSPSSFPALPMSSSAPGINTNVFLAAYPAQLLGGETIQKDLYASSALTTVQQLYTFNNPANVDLVSLGGSVVAQTGSSGGAVVNAVTGQLVGLIATETEGTTTASRNLNAITLAHINRSLISLGMDGIGGLLNGNLQQQASNFATITAPGETNQLETVLNKTIN